MLRQSSPTNSNLSVTTNTDNTSIFNCLINNEYKSATNNASPTTGWIAYHLLHDDFPNAEVVLVNFKPDGNNGSYKWYKHDWHYEAEYYRKHKVPIRVLF